MNSRLIKNKEKQKKHVFLILTSVSSLSIISAKSVIKCGKFGSIFFKARAVLGGTLAEVVSFFAISRTKGYKNILQINYVAMVYSNVFISFYNSSCSIAVLVCVG